MPTDFQRLFLDRLYANEEQLQEQANAIDAKANYLLVAQTLIASLFVPIFGHQHSVVAIVLDILAVLLLATAIIQVAMLLRNRDYVYEGAPDLAAWYKRQMDWYSANYPADVRDHPEEIDAEIIAALSREAAWRISQNNAHNEKKADHFESALVVTLYSLFAILLSLAITTFI